VSGWKALSLAFFVGFVIRLVPEVLSYPHPIGFDTVYYATVMKSGVVWPHWGSFFGSSWLLLALIVSFRSLVGVDPFSLLKVLGPVLFGLNVAGVYWFARKALAWNVRLSVFASGFFALQLASLRISWDLLRNTLGLGLLLFTLPLIGLVDSRRGLVGFIVLGLLTVFAHEYAAVTLLVVVLGLLVWRFLKRRVDASWKRLLVGVVPSLTVFAVGVWVRFLQLDSAVGSNVIEVGDGARGYVRGVFFLVDYLGVKSSTDSYGSYWGLASSVLALFVLLYLSYSFLIWKGYFGNEILGTWTALLVVGAFGCLVFPFCALEYWHRWMFMFVYPFTFYAANGLRVSFKVFGEGIARLPSRKATGMVLVTVLLGVSYLFTPVLMARANVNVSSFPMTCTYFSVSPTVPYEDVDDVAQAMQWLQGRLSQNSCVILQHAFLSWGKLYLDNSQIIVHFELDVDSAVNVALERGFDHVFSVWWNVDIGWYGVSMPSGFVPAGDFGRLSVYEYSGGMNSG